MLPLPLLRIKPNSVRLKSYKKVTIVNKIDIEATFNIANRICFHNRSTTKKVTHQKYYSKIMRITSYNIKILKWKMMEN